MVSGIQVSSLRPLLKTPEQVSEAFSRFARMGCKAVQVQWIDPSVPPEHIARTLRDTGMSSVSVQDFYTDVSADPEYYTKLCIVTGSEWLCVSRVPEEYKTAPGITAFARALDRLSDTIAPMGLKLCFHPTSPDYQMIDGRTLVDALMDAVQRPLSLCLDLYHIWKSGLSMPGLIRQYSGRVCMVHFKDCRGDELVPAGQGEIDWEPAIEACLQTEVAYGFVEQETWARDPFECMDEALSWLDEQLWAKPTCTSDGITFSAQK